MLRLIFARHGESEANLLHEFSNTGLKHGLTEKGRLQAEILAKRLRRMQVTRIYASPLLRAVQTAEIIAAELGLPFTIHEALREYDVGIYEGRSDAAAWARYNEVDDAWMLHGEAGQRMEGGESLNDIRARFEPFIRELAGQFGAQSESILLVSHGGLYRTMLPQILSNVSAAFSLAHPLRNTGYVTAELRPEGWLCTGWQSDDETHYTVFA